MGPDHLVYLEQRLHIFPFCSQSIGLFCDPDLKEKHHLVLLLSSLFSHQGLLMYQVAHKRPIHF